MKFVLLSDIHADVNLWNWSMLDGIASDVNVAVVAGDIDNDVWATSRWLLELKQRFNTVIWVAGNHDFYNLGFHQTRLRGSDEWEAKWPYPKTVAEIYNHYRRWSEEHGIIFLNRSSVVIDGVRFAGATGWHDYIAGAPHSTEDQIQTWYKCINDTVIKWNNSVSPDHLAPYEAGVKDANSLAHIVEHSVEPCVVITHHVPHRSLLWQRPENMIWTMLHGSFANTKLESIKDPKINYWIYGHTHQRNMKMIGDTVYVCNARGYKHENPNWEPIVLEL